MARVRTECSECLNTVYVPRSDTELTRCPLCACYHDGVVTPAEALAQLPHAMNVGKKKAGIVRAVFLLHNGPFRYPEGYVAKTERTIA